MSSTERSTKSKPFLVWILVLKPQLMRFIKASSAYRISCYIGKLILSGNQVAFPAKVFSIVKNVLSVFRQIQRFPSFVKVVLCCVSD